MSSLNRRTFLAASAAGLATQNALAASWNQWRGPSRNGMVDGNFEWPDKISGRLKEVWRRPLQPSYSGPIVSEGQIYLTETVDKRDEVVTAVGLQDGKKQWSQSWPGAMSVPFFARANGSWIRSTPAVSDGRLLVGGIRDVMVCLDTATGAKIWENDFVATQKSDLPSFGFVCSPLIDGDYAYVQAGGGLLKLELATGNVVWRSLADGGGMYGSAFSSPVIATIGGVEQLLVQTRKELAGVSPEDGRKLWSVEVPAFRGMNILPPTVFGDTVFTSSYGGGSFCYSIQQSGDSWTVEKLWKNTVQGYMSSPMVFGEHVYLHLKNRRFTCMDLKTGRQKWSSRPYGKYWSSAVQGDRILALDERGKLLLIQPTPDEFTLLDEKDVATNSWAHLAVVDDMVLVRDLNELIVLRWA